QPVGEDVLVQLAGRDGKVLPLARKVGEPDVHDLDPRVAGFPYDALGGRLGAAGRGVRLLAGWPAGRHRGIPPKKLAGRPLAADGRPAFFTKVPGSMGECRRECCRVSSRLCVPCTNLVTDSPRIGRNVEMCIVNGANYARIDAH